MVAYVVDFMETGVIARKMVAFTVDYRKHVRDCLHDELYTGNIGVIAYVVVCRENRCNCQTIHSPYGGLSKTST